MIRDYLNVYDLTDMRDYLLAHGQAVAVVTVDYENPKPLETWYFDENSMLEDNGTTVLKPNELLETDPGRYLKSMTSSDWGTTLNKPAFSDVAFTGDYNDLENKITAGSGLLMSSNELSVDDSQFMSVPVANTAIANMESEIATKAPLNRSITVNGITKTLETNISWQVGNVSTDESYNNPAWITALNASKISGLANVATSGNYVDLANKPTIPTVNYPVTSVNTKTGAVTLNASDVGAIATGSNIPYSTLTGTPTIPTNTNQLTNGAGFLTTVPPQSFSSLTGKPTTLAGYGITDGINQAGVRAAISLTTTGTSGAATYDNSTGNINIPNYTVSSPSFNNTAVKTINAAGVQISTTRNTRVSYTITHTIALTLLLSSGSSMVYLEVSPNNSTWTSISQAGFSDAVAVAVALNKTSTNNVQGEVQAGWYVRLRAVTSGAGSAAFTVGQEIQY